MSQGTSPESPLTNDQARTCSGLEIGETVGEEGRTAEVVHDSAVEVISHIKPLDRMKTGGQARSSSPAASVDIFSAAHRP